MLSTFPEARLSRYAIATGAVVAAIPTQAAPITVILPSPINIATTPLNLDIDGVGGTDLLFFSGSGGVSGGLALQPATGFQFFSAFTSTDFWNGGYAWEAGASSLTTFDLRGSSSDIPEPATGALALGALAVAARKRKQA